MKTINTQGRGEAIELKTDAQGRVMTGAAAAARQSEALARKAALAFVLRYDSESEKLPTVESRRNEVEAVYHYYCAAAFGRCGIMPASRAVLWGYGASRRAEHGLRSSAALGNGASCRLGARGLLPFAALLAWRRAFRRAANEARSLLNGRGPVFLGGEDGERELAAIPARGVGDGGHVQRGGELWARGATDAGDAWARSLAHAGQCLRAHWLLASGPGGKGASQRASSGLADDLARLDACAAVAGGEGLLSLGADWLGNGRACTKTAKEAVARLKRRIASGDKVLTDHPERAALVLGASLSAPWGAGESASLPGVRLGACDCFACQRVRAGSLVIRDTANAARVPARVLRDAGEVRTLASDTWRLEPVRTWSDAPQGVRWWHSLRQSERANVERLLGIVAAPAASAPAAPVSPWAVLSQVRTAPAPHVALAAVGSGVPLSRGQCAAMVRTADRAVRAATRRLIVARVLWLRAIDRAAAACPRVAKVAAALASASASHAKAAPSKRERAARKLQAVRAEYGRKRVAAALRMGAEYDDKGRMIDSEGQRLRAAREAARDALLAAETHAAGVRGTAARAARLRSARAVASVAAARAASVARRSAAAEVERLDLAAARLASLDLGAVSLA